MSETLPLPGTVRVVTTTPHYARTRNGAWVGAGASHATRNFDWTPGDAFDPWRPSGYDTHRLEYPDGRVEILTGGAPCSFSEYGPEAGNKPADYPSSKWSRALGAIGYHGWEPHARALAERGLTN